MMVKKEMRCNGKTCLYKHEDVHISIEHRNLYLVMSHKKHPGLLRIARDTGSRLPLEVVYCWVRLHPHLCTAMDKTIFTFVSYTY